MTLTRFASFLRLSPSILLRTSLLVVLLAGTFLQPQTVYAAANLTVTPITWNVIGLDSNNVNVGPNHFPIGARVCNTGDTPAANVTASFVWDSSNTYVNNRPGTLTTLSVPSLSNVPPNNCTDFYFEVEVTRNSAAYDTTRNYHIQVTADGGLSASTPTPRTLYVEHLVSQSRNAVTDIRYGTSLADLALPASSVAPGGTMTLMVGNVYYIRLIGYTATQGYEQLESFINIPNVIFQTVSVATTYTADTSATVSSPNDKAYGDACNWENDPNSPNYRSCLSTGKVGGNITVTYQVRILQVPGAPLVNPAPLSSLIYDFSGSSFHYNADYDVATRFANIVNASITKSFSPKTITPGQTSTLTFTVRNPGPAALTGVNFSDTLPAGMTLANTTVTYTGCGASPSPAALTINGPPQSLSFSNITVAGLGTCGVAVNVTASTDSIYNNTSGNLFINSTTNTGSFATDSLAVSSLPPAPSTCTTRSPLATWTLENYTATTTASATGTYNASSLPGTGVTQGIATFIVNGSSTTAIANPTTYPAAWGNNLQPSTTGNSGNSWGIDAGWLGANPANPVTAATSYFQFRVDGASNYGGIGITASYNMQGNWSNAGNWYVLFSTDGTNWSNPIGGTGVWDKANAWQIAGITTNTTTTSPTVYFRVYAAGAQNSTATLYLDSINITGCPRPVVPTLSKAFTPATIPQGSNSTLTFTLANPNATALTGVGFTDTLPIGLVIATPNGLTTACTAGTLTGGTTTAASGTSLISLSGATLSANANCTISVSVRGNVAGQYTNISSSITSAETGPNTTSTGYGTSSLTVVAPPVIAKSFAANPIFTGASTTLTFSINNPNTSTTLTGINFTDTLPAGLDVVNSTTAQCGGTLTVANNAPAQDTISLSGGSLVAGGSCSFNVTVTGNTTGLKTNSVTVSSTNGGTGNTDTAVVLVKDPAPAINLLKQVGPTASGPWTSFLGVTLPANVYYRLVVENVGDLPLNSVTVTDPTVSTAACAWVDGDGTSLASPFTLPVANANDDQVATCVLGPVTAVAGSNPNTATASGTNGGTTVTDTSSARYGTTALTLVKSVTQTSFTTAGDTLDYSYLVTNSGFAPLPGPVTVTDDKVTVACPAVTTVGDNDTWFDPGENLTCTATYTVTAGDVAAGFVTNTASAVAGGVTSNTDSRTVNAPSDLTVSKTNNVSGSVAQNGTFNWTITVSNIGTGAAPFADGILILSDPLPGVDGYYPQGALTVVNGATPPTGTISCSITGSALSCAANGAVTLPAGASFNVTFAVTPTAAGSLANTATVDPAANVTETDETNNTASDTVSVVAPPSIAKVFSPNLIAVGGTSTLTFTVTNPNAATALTGVGFTDTLPSGLQVAAAPNAAVSAGCGSPAFTPSAADTSLTFSGGTIPASGTCTVTVDITGTAAGTMRNTTGTITSSNGGTGNTASAVLGVVSAAKTIASTSESNTGFVSGFERVAIGEVIRYRLTTELPEGAWTNVQITDAIDAGLLFLNDGTASVSYVCDGSCTNSTFTITPATFVSGTDPVFNLGTVTNPDTDVNSEYLVVEFNALMLNLASNNSGGFTRNNSYTISFNGATITSLNVGVRVAEPSITNLTKTVSPAAGPYYPGDVITYTLTYSNGATGVGRATAFDVFLADALSSNLDLQSVTVTAPGISTVTNTSTLGAGGVVRVLVDQLPPAVDISSGPTGVTITVTARIVNTAPGGTLSNTANVTYTGLPGGVTTGDANGTCPNITGSCTPGTSGSLTGERNGTGGSPNTYTDSSTMDITVTPSADLSVTKTDGSDSYTPGGTVTYTVTVANNGPSDVTGASFNDAIPSQITEWTWTCAPGAGASCTAGPATSSADFTDTIDLPSGSSVTYTVVATIGSSATGDLVNTATVNAPTGVNDPVPGNNSSTDTNTFAGVPAHTTVKTQTSTGPYAVGGTITYNIAVTNTGNITLTGVTASDSSATLGTCTPAQPAILAPDASMTCPASHVVTQADVDAGSYANTATGDSDQTTPSTSTVTVTFAQNPAHTTVKTQTSTGPYAVGDTISYNIVVTNTGNVTLTGVTASDSSATLGTCTPAQPATLAPGVGMTCPASHVVTQADVDAGSYVNTATGDSDQTTPSTSTVTVNFTQTPAINIAKTPPTQTILSGDSANFTMTVTNVGNVTLSGVSVTDAQCMTGPTYTGGDTNNDSLLQLTEIWTYSCSVSNVLANFTNTASVSTTQGATDSDSAEVLVTILEADLSLSKSVSNTSPLVATNIDFTLSVTNSGPDTATGVQVTDVIPGGFAYVSHSASQGTYNSGTGVWNVGTLVVNQTETLTLTVTVNISGPYTNYAEITASDQVDPDSTPNNDSTDEDDDDSVTVTPTQNNPNLGKSVSGSNQPFTTNPNVAVGEIVEYTVTVNVPPGVFANAQLVDTMERGLSFMTCASITASNAALTTDVAGSFTGACSSSTVDDAGGGTTVDVGRRVTFNLGTLTNASGADQTLTFVYTAVVLDSAGNVSGVTLDNSAVWASNSGTQPASTASVVVIEPDLSITKTANTALVSVGAEFTVTLTIQHTAASETNAYDALVTDTLPTQLELVPGTLECISGAQNANLCNYDTGTRTISAAWNTFVRGGGDGRVTFRVRVVTVPSGGITNVASVAWTSLPGDVGTPQNSNVFSTERGYDPASQIDVYGRSTTLTIGVFSSTPATGFAPNVITDLRNAPKEAYAQTGGVRVEIPSLGVSLPIVGVPLKNGEWNVSWLGNQAGWLEGSAFPSWSGNSVLTSHVYGSNGLPGPFVNLNKLKYGDRIIIHAYGAKYTYEVRANTVVEPDDASIFRHEEKAWLTLVTCKEYDAKTNTYKKRVVVRAVLVGVER